jgi:hypothetical protein
LGQFVLRNPIIPDVSGLIVEEWYTSQLIISAAISAAIGFIWAMISPKKVLHQPNETGQDYISRVLSYGLKGMAFAGAVVLLVACFRAARFNPEFADEWIDQIVDLVQGKCISILFVSAPAMGLIWASVIRTFGDWGGARALFGSKGGN